MSRFFQHIQKSHNICFLSSPGQPSSCDPLLVFLMLLAQNMLMWLIPRHIQKEPMALHSREDQACQAAAEPVEGVQTRVEVDAHWT